jgi:hypothetical protein
MLDANTCGFFRYVKCAYTIKIGPKMTWDADLCHIERSCTSSKRQVTTGADVRSHFSFCIYLLVVVDELNCVGSME